MKERERKREREGERERGAGGKYTRALEGYTARMEEC